MGFGVDEMITNDKIMGVALDTVEAQRGTAERKREKPNCRRS